MAPLNEQSNQIARLKQLHQSNIKTETDKTQSCSVELNKLDEKSCKFEEAIVKAEGDFKVKSFRLCNSFGKRFVYLVRSSNARG